MAVSEAIGGSRNATQTLLILNIPTCPVSPLHPLPFLATFLDGRLDLLWLFSLNCLPYLTFFLFFFFVFFFKSFMVDSCVCIYLRTLHLFYPCMWICRTLLCRTQFSQSRLPFSSSIRPKFTDTIRRTLLHERISHSLSLSHSLSFSLTHTHSLYDDYEYPKKLFSCHFPLLSLSCASADY